MMTSRLRQAICWLWLLVAVAGCVSTRGTGAVNDRAGQLSAVIAPVCVGTIEPPPTLNVVSDEALLSSALGAPGQGRLCAGRTYVTTAPMTVFRLWNRSQSHTQFGRWWTLSRPAQPVAQLRESLEICPEWSPLDALSECTLRAGTHVVLGTGQSARCEAGVHYGQSDTVQLYVANDTRAVPAVVYVDNCHELSWPP